LFEKLSEGAKIIHISYPQKADMMMARPYLKIIDEKEDYRVRRPTWRKRGETRRSIHNPRAWEQETTVTMTRKGKVTKTTKKTSRQKGYEKAHMYDDERKTKLYDRVIIIQHALEHGPNSGKTQKLSTYKCSYDTPPKDRKKVKDALNVGKLQEVDRYV